MNLDKQKYPIGRFHPKNEYTMDEIKTYITTLSEFPNKLRSLVEPLSEEQLNKPYRDGGWTIKQLVHHCADSHMNSIIRFKWALTENKPTIKPYNQDEWAKLPDNKLPIEVSLSILDGVHARLSCLLDSLKEEEFTKILNHPEMNHPIDIAFITAMYAWHSEHHLAHISLSIKRESYK